MQFIKNVAFFGSSEAELTGALYKSAFKTAKLLAEKGLTIINGGGPGVMDASTKGAAAGKGETLVISFAPQDAPGFEGRYVGNVPDREIKTGNYIERMFKLIEHADTFVVFNGGVGTLSEMATAWVLAKLYYGHHKPFVLYGKFWKKVMACINRWMKVPDEANANKVYRIVTKPSEVYQVLRDFEKQMASHEHEHCLICSDKAFMR